MKTLHLLRHAKSDWDDPSLDDHDRPLNRRGAKARHTIARHVEGWPVDVVVCSTAVRARATAEPVVEAIGCELVLEPAIYDAGSGELIDVVRRLPDGAAVVLLVGHNPGFEELSRALTGEAHPYTTAALGTIELDVDGWTDVAPGCGRLVAHVSARELDDRA